MAGWFPGVAAFLQLSSGSIYVNDLRYVAVLGQLVELGALKALHIGKEIHEGVFGGVDGCTDLD